MNVKIENGVLVSIHNDRDTTISFQEWMLSRSRALRRRFGTGRFIACGEDFFIAFFDEVDAFEITTWLRRREADL